MHIVGGIYRETCVFPEDDVIYGSGGRAAAALSEMCPDLSLSAFVGNLHRKIVDYHAEQVWKSQLNAYPTNETLSFRYLHGLSKPVIDPTPVAHSNDALIEVSDDVVLQFGMLEGKARVHGKRVIYDPQNPVSPEKFDQVNSTAQELAYVVNASELRRLTNCENLSDAANYLLALQSVKVVLVKLGIQGARVYSNDAVETVVAYATNRVWPIGSGDVFGAAFAYYWGVRHVSPKEAALFASRATAIYCDSRRLPLISEELESLVFPYHAIQLERPPREATIYLAGPFFTMSQLWMVNEVREILSNGNFGVFSPYHDVGLGSADQVVEEDIKGIENCNAMLAICDGIDAGTFFEIGYAVKKGIPVIAIGQQTTEESMKMLVGTGCRVFRDFASAIYHVKWAALS